MVYSLKQAIELSKTVFPNVVVNSEEENLGLMNHHQQQGMLDHVR